MKATSESSSNLGSPISMRDVLIRVWDQGYQSPHFRRSRFRPDDITFRITIACRQFPYSAAFTTNINWKKSRLEKFRMSYLRSTITVVDARLHIVDHHSFRTSLKKLQTTFETIDDGIDILTKDGNHAAQAAVAKRHHECLNDSRLLTAQFMNQPKPPKIHF